MTFLIFEGRVKHKIDKEHKMNNRLVSFSTSDICAEDPKEIPVAISNCFASLKEVESKVEKACAAAKKSLDEARKASGKTINCIGWGTKDAVYALQTAVEAGALSQQTQQEVLDRILAFQQATAKGMKYLFQLGATGIAANRAVSKAIRDRMNEIDNGDPSEFDEYVMAELSSTLAELKRQEDILIKQEKLNDIQRAMREEMRSMNDELERREEDSERQAEELKRQADKDREHDAELSRQAKKDQEHDEQIGMNAKGVEHNAKAIEQNGLRIDQLENAIKDIRVQARGGSSSWSAAGFAIIVAVVSLLISIACIIIVCKTPCGE